MFIVDVVESTNDEKVASYMSNTIEEAKDLVFILMTYSSDESEKTERTIAYVDENFETIVGAKNNPMICEIVSSDEESYSLHVYEDKNTNICSCS